MELRTAGAEAQSFGLHSAISLGVPRSYPFSHLRVIEVRDAAGRGVTLIVQFVREMEGHVEVLRRDGLGTETCGAGLAVASPPSADMHSARFCAMRGRSPKSRGELKFIYRETKSAPQRLVKHVAGIGAPRENFCFEHHGRKRGGHDPIRKMFANARWRAGRRKPCIHTRQGEGFGNDNSAWRKYVQCIDWTIWRLLSHRTRQNRCSSSWSRPISSEW